MATSPTSAHPTKLSTLYSLDWSGALLWLLGFGGTVYLGLKGGGYDPLVHDQVGIVVWWILLGAVLVGALPRERPGALGWWALGLMAAFFAWTVLSFFWTESAEQTSADVARILGYLGVFALAVLARAPGGARKAVAAVGTGVVVVSIVALLSRLHPAWFSATTGQTAAFLPGSQERLSYPLNYWNGLAGLIAIGLPLMLQLATDGRRILTRALAAAALPALMLTIFFTLSRAGIAAAVVATGIFFVFTSDRLPKLLTALVAGTAGAALVYAASSHDSLTHGLSDAAAHHQGNEILTFTVLACLVVGLAQVGISVGLAHSERPEWSVVSKTASLRALLAGVLVALVVAIAIGAPHRLSDAWSEFKQSDTPVGGAQRLGSVAGESRYRIWTSAVREMESKPLTGTGSGTFQYWWNRDGTASESVIDTHSLYLQSLGELGIVGFLLIVSFLLVLLIGGASRVLAVEPRRRPPLAAALAGCGAFCVSATFDWVWQIPVLAVAMLLLAAVLVTADTGERRALTGPLPALPRIAFGIAALAAIAAIAIPLASTSLLRQSQADAREGRPAAALDAARGAQNAEPYAASPRLQQALILESEGELALAASAARAATDREATNWRNWLVLSRVEARRGRVAAAVRAYREARSLNPRSPVFAN